MSRRNTLRGGYFIVVHTEAGRSGQRQAGGQRQAETGRGRRAEAAETDKGRRAKAGRAKAGGGRQRRTEAGGQRQAGGRRQAGGAETAEAERGKRAEAPHDANG